MAEAVDIFFEQARKAVGNAQHQMRLPVEMGNAFLDHRFDFSLRTLGDKSGGELAGGKKGEAGGEFADFAVFLLELGKAGAQRFADRGKGLRGLLLDPGLSFGKPALMARGFTFGARLGADGVEFFVRQLVFFARCVHDDGGVFRAEDVVEHELHFLFVFLHHRTHQYTSSSSSLLSASMISPRAARSLAMLTMAI